MHKYLGMNLDCREDGKVKIDMTDYLKKILDYLPIKFQGRAITPAANYIFEVNNTTRKLSKKDAQAFHTIVEKLLFLCKQAQPYVLTRVAFLMTPVREPDEDGNRNLLRILKYLSSTRYPVLALESDSTSTLK